MEAPDRGDTGPSLMVDALIGLIGAGGVSILILMIVNQLHRC